jgi:hypothetical protein
MNKSPKNTSNVLIEKPKASPVGHPRNLAGVAYSPELLDAIIKRIAGGEALLHICKEAGMPNRVTVMEWLKKTDSMGRYEDAVKTRAHIYAEQIVTIPDDYIGTYTDSQGNTRIDPGAVAVAKLRSENRKWLVSKQLPKVYGDRITQELVGADGADLIPQHSDLEIARRLAFLLQGGLISLKEEKLVEI